MILNLLFTILLLIGSGGHPESGDCSKVYDSLAHREVYVMVDKMPEHPEGTKGILKAIGYLSVHKGEEFDNSSFFMEFIIEVDGKLSHVSVRKERGAALTESDKRMIALFEKMPNWIPGQCRSKTVPVKMIYPVKICYSGGE